MGDRALYRQVPPQGITRHRPSQLKNTPHNSLIYGAGPLELATEPCSREFAKNIVFLLGGFADENSSFFMTISVNNNKVLWADDDGLRHSSPASLIFYRVLSSTSTNAQTSFTVFATYHRKNSLPRLTNQAIGLCKVIH